MIKISFTGSSDQVSEATLKANQLLQDPSFFQKIEAHGSFDLATATPKEVSDIIKNSVFQMTIELYRPRNPFSKALAYDDARHPLVIHLNSRRLNRSVASICATIIHECVHAADAMEGKFSFGHGDNTPSGKENTAPYWIDNLAYTLISGGQPAFVVFQHDDINNDREI